MMTRRVFWSGALILLVLAGCAKKVPVSPEPAASAPPVVAPTETAEELARRRQQELQASIEERERRAAEERQRQQGEEQARLAQDAFLNQDVHFAYDSATLSEEAKAILAHKATWLAGQDGVAVQIEGHCDERGTVAYNLALGERRANTVKQYLTALGVGSERLSTISYGEEFPVDTRRNEEAWAKNRRVHFAIITP